MSMPLKKIQDGLEDARPLSPQTQAQLFPGKKWLTLLFWSAVCSLLVAAILMRLYQLDVPFGLDYDEGVYWQSLRSLLSGQNLYHTIFYSQPPAFLLSIFPSFALLGGSLWAARFGIALVSLLGFVGIGLLGKALAGRLGSVAGLLLLAVNLRYLSESRILQAEIPSVALTLLAIGCALLWWKEPDSWRGIVWAALAGAALALSILCKLLCISTLVPIALLLGARLWQIWRKQPGTTRRSWWPILAGIGSGLLVTLAVLLPFLGSWSDLWSGVVTFHDVAARTMPASPDTNSSLILTDLNSLLDYTALHGTLVALWRRNWLVWPLLAWALVTLFLLARQNPLFDHHLIALVPPLLALTLLGIANPASSQDPKALFARWRVKIAAKHVVSLAWVLILITAFSSVYFDVQYYQDINTASNSAATQQALQIARDLRQATTPDQWVITDGQFIAGLAERNTPPSLVDTSTVRITTGYITLAQLEQQAADPRVHAVLFYGNRLATLPQVQEFHTWVSGHYHLVHSYGPGQELWVR